MKSSWLSLHQRIEVSRWMHFAHVSALYHISDQLFFTPLFLFPKTIQVPSMPNSVVNTCLSSLHQSFYDQLKFYGNPSWQKHGKDDKCPISNTWCVWTSLQGDLIMTSISKCGRTNDTGECWGWSLTFPAVGGHTYRYPVFPWVISNYTSDELDLTDPAVSQSLRMVNCCPGISHVFVASCLRWWWRWISELSGSE